MGNRKSTCHLLKDYELMEYSKISSFTQDEIDQIYHCYVHFSASHTDDGVIDYFEFCQAMHIPDTLVTRRIFRIFDANRDGVINFREFLTGLTYFLCETTEHQVLLSFRLFDIDAKGYCTQDDLKSILVCYLETMKSSFVLSRNNAAELEKIAERLVEETYRRTGLEVGSNVSYEKYRQLYFKHSIASKWLLMDMEKLKQGVMIISGKVANDKANKKKSTSCFQLSC
eukprot:TRINITY_DN17238_c0_g1_i1.p1 TRINITY_DN17238_c0_g1~~TRINITY_DN17238_c0_g1_i1.p1  ORF type:complete len:227 (+),score=40.76 TRINITY_DN17238_c0_g1_i1:60-740(+)